jgi:hypothetical protein
VRECKILHEDFSLNCGVYKLSTVLLVRTTVLVLRTNECFSKLRVGKERSWPRTNLISSQLEIAFGFPQLLTDSRMSITKAYGDSFSQSDLSRPRLWGHDDFDEWLKSGEGL